MRADLERHRVLVAVEAPADEPTTLALVDVDPTGVPGPDRTRRSGLP
jgi:hypothetical protein